MTTTSTGIALQVLQGLVLIILSPGLYGLLDYFKAREQGRRRRWVYLLQPYWDLWKLLRQPAVHPLTSSWLFAITPGVVFVAYAWLAFAVPVLYRPPLLAVDLIVVIYVLGLARFTLSLAGLDAGAAFGGLGSSREMFLHFLTEVSLILVLAALALRWGTISLADLFAKHAVVRDLFNKPELLFLALALAAILLIETGRIPVDNPDTHLELTMGQKAIILEFAGRDLALIEWAEMIKLGFLLALSSSLFLPFLNLANWIKTGDSFVNTLEMGASFLVQMILLARLTAWWELHQPKLRLRKVAVLAWSSMLFSLATIIFVIATRS